jgi:hypothetical protein
MLDTGYWILDAGYGILDTGYWMLDAGCWIRDTGSLFVIVIRRQNIEDRRPLIHH